MEDFETRRSEYIKTIRDHLQTVNDNSVNGINISNENVQILLNPQNEREIEIGNMFLSFLGDVITLTEDIYAEEVKEIPNEDNKCFNLYIKTINGLKNKEDKSKLSIKNITSKEGARIIYDLYVGFISSPIDTIFYIGEQTGFDLINDDEYTEFTGYLDDAKTILNEIDIVNNCINSKDEKEITFTKDLLKEFHTLCIKGRKDCNNDKNTLSKKLTID